MELLKLTSGLVGGHCIGVDPYYLTYKAEEIGYHSQIIVAERKINDNMVKYVAENTVKLMIQANKQIKGVKVAILGLTFKENFPDVRNTEVIDVINELKEYGINVIVHAVILAVLHEEYKELKLEDISSLYNYNYAYINGNKDIDYKKVFINIKGMFNRKDVEEMDYLYSSL